MSYSYSGIHVVTPLMQKNILQSSKIYEKINCVRTNTAIRKSDRCIKSSLGSCHHSNVTSYQTQPDIRSGCAIARVRQTYSQPINKYCNFIYFIIIYYQTIKIYFTMINRIYDIYLFKKINLHNNTKQALSHCH